MSIGAGIQVNGLALALVLADYQKALTSFLRGLKSKAQQDKLIQ